MTNDDEEGADIDQNHNYDLDEEEMAIFQHQNYDINQVQTNKETRNKETEPEREKKQKPSTKLNLRENKISNRKRRVQMRGKGSKKGNSSISSPSGDSIIKITIIK